MLQHAQAVRSTAAVMTLLHAAEQACQCASAKLWSGQASRKWRPGAAWQRVEGSAAESRGLHLAAATSPSSHVRSGCFKPAPCCSCSPAPGVSLQILPLVLLCPFYLAACICSRCAAARLAVLLHLHECRRIAAAAVLARLSSFLSGGECKCMPA